MALLVDNPRVGPATAAASGRVDPPVLSVEAVSVHFGQLRALDGLDLVVRPGEIVALAGENGAGKSTLVRCVAGDIVPTAGRVQVDGQSVGADPAIAAALGVAVVWQDLALCDNLDVASNLLLGSESRRLMLSDTRFHAEARRVLRDLDVPLPDTTRSVRTLSGGQRQVLAVARAVKDRPRLLILDEPTAALGVRWSVQVETLTRRLRDLGTTVLLVTHDIDQMFRMADRIAVLRNGQIVAEVDPVEAHPDDVVALMSGQQIDVSARRQLDRLQGLVDRLTSADPASSLTLIVSALGAALGADRLCLHLLDGDSLRVGASLGVPEDLVRRWDGIPAGGGGGSPGSAALDGKPVLDLDVQTSPGWADLRHVARAHDIGGSWSVPVAGTDGPIGVITVLRRAPGAPSRDELHLVGLYAGYAAGTIERERLLDQLTARNRVLETIREVLEALTGPTPLGTGLGVALGALRIGLGAAWVGLAQHDRPRPDPALAAPAGTAPRPVWRATSGPLRPPEAMEPIASPPDGRARPLASIGRAAGLAVGVAAPTGTMTLVAWWPEDVDGNNLLPDATLLEDAARSFQLALEREEADRAHQETRALRRSQELQRHFLSRLSHELRTPLTAIRGYASSLTQPDVSWDTATERRFLACIATESARVGRLVDDLLDFSAIESEILRLQLDWCDVGLVLEAAAACLAPDAVAQLTLRCAPGLPPIWADHDRLEQVLVNLVDNAVRHNPAGTEVVVSAEPLGGDAIALTVSDAGQGMPAAVLAAPFDPHRAKRGPTAGAGLGLSIAKGIVDAHRGRFRIETLAPGTRFRLELPVEPPEGAGPASGGDGPGPGSAALDA